MTPDRPGYAAEMNARFDALDRALVARGFPATSPWWRSEVRRYFESSCRQVVLRVGRRGGKSSTLCRIAVVEALYGRHVVPPGDLGVVAVVSVNRDEASQRLRTIKAILDALGVSYRPIDGGIELEGRPVGFKVYTASVSGVSGFTAICVLADEVSKWKDADTGINPATEVLASIRPTMATQPLAKIVLSSSPMGKLDAHAAAFEAGDNDFQVVACAPTWLANPTITEADTHSLEPDEMRWRREYAAVPLEDTDAGVFSSALLDRATRSEPLVLPREDRHDYVAAQDPALRGDAWTFVIATCRWVQGVAKRSIVLAREWRSSRAQPLNPDAVFAEIAATCREYGVSLVYSDQHSGDALAYIAMRHDLTLYVEPTTAANKIARYEALSTRLADGEIELPPDPQLRADLLAVTKRLTPSGFTIELPRVGGRHADYAPAVALALSKPLSPPPPPQRTLTAEERAAAERAAIHADTTAHWESLDEQLQHDRAERWASLGDVE